MIVKIKKTGDEEFKHFTSESQAGAWLREQNWPEHLLSAPDADRVGLARVLRGSPWEVEYVYDDDED